MIRLLFVGSFIVGSFMACGSAANPTPSHQADPTLPTTEAETEPTEARAATNEIQPAIADQPHRCLPLVSGCGCADRCADGFQQVDESWGVVRPLGRSALDDVILEHLCFDQRGVSRPQTAPGEAGCIDVFRQPDDCGGQCLPRTEFLRCEFDAQGTCTALSGAVPSLF